MEHQPLCGDLRNRAVLGQEGKMPGQLPLGKAMQGLILKINFSLP